MKPSQMLLFVSALFGIADVFAYCYGLQPHWVSMFIADAMILSLAFLHFRECRND